MCVCVSVLYKSPYWKCYFSYCSGCRSFCHDFQKGRRVTLSCTYLSSFFYIWPLSLPLESWCIVWIIYSFDKLFAWVELYMNHYSLDRHTKLTKQFRSITLFLLKPTDDANALSLFHLFLCLFYYISFILPRVLSVLNSFWLAIKLAMFTNRYH